MNLSNKFLALCGFVSFTCLAISAHADPTDLSTAMKAETQKSDAPSPTSGKVCTYTVEGLAGKYSDSAAATVAAENASIGTIVIHGECSPARNVAHKPHTLIATSTVHNKQGTGPIVRHEVPGYAKGTLSFASSDR